MALTFSDLRGEYARLLSTMTIRPDKLAALDATARKIVAGRSRYEAVSKATGVPWQLIGVIHAMECGLSFKSHLHNGDPLTARTRQVPAGRPKIGSPPSPGKRAPSMPCAMTGSTRWPTGPWSASATSWMATTAGATGSTTPRCSRPTSGATPTITPAGSTCRTGSGMPPLSPGRPAPSRCWPASARFRNRRPSARRRPRRPALLNRPRLLPSAPPPERLLPSPPAFRGGKSSSSRWAAPSSVWPWS